MCPGGGGLEGFFSPQKIQVLHVATPQKRPFDENSRTEGAGIDPLPL